jgi:PIN domain nuclease of toxin-antitoxin system
MNWLILRSDIATAYYKLPEAKQIVEEYSQILTQAQFVELKITSAHAIRAGSLPIDHRDPFDRMIMAQAELEKIPVITYDKEFQTGLIDVIP